MKHLTVSTSQKSTEYSLTKAKTCKGWRARDLKHVLEKGGKLVFN